MNFSIPRGVGGTKVLDPLPISGAGRLPPPGICKGTSVPITLSCPRPLGVLPNAAERSERAELGRLGRPPATGRPASLGVLRVDTPPNKQHQRNGGGEGQNVRYEESPCLQNTAKNTLQRRDQGQVLTRLRQRMLSAVGSARAAPSADCGLPGAGPWARC